MNQRLHRIILVEQLQDGVKTEQNGYEFGGDVTAERRIGRWPHHIGQAQNRHPHFWVLLGKARRKRFYFDGVAHPAMLLVAIQRP